MITLLQKYVDDEDYEDAATLSTDIFKFNIDHFLYADSIEEQIHLEGTSKYPEYRQRVKGV